MNLTAAAIDGGELHCRVLMLSWCCLLTEAGLNVTKRVKVAKKVKHGFQLTTLGQCGRACRARHTVENHDLNGFYCTTSNSDTSHPSALEVYNPTGALWNPTANLRLGSGRFHAERWNCLRYSAENVTVWIMRSLNRGKQTSPLTLEQLLVDRWCCCLKITICNRRAWPNFTLRPTRPHVYIRHYGSGSGFKCWSLGHGQFMGLQTMDVHLLQLYHLFPLTPDQHSGGVNRTCVSSKK